VQIPLLGPRAAATYAGRKAYVGMRVGVPAEVAEPVAARTTRTIEGTGAGAIVAHTGHSELTNLHSHLVNIHLGSFTFKNGRTQSCIRFISNLNGFETTLDEANGFTI
jgi:hypothetical protein